jgi:protein-S-isoprenylcysteine O-methyltransferase Ste14
MSTQYQNNKNRDLSIRYLFEGQIQHILMLACILPGGVYLAQPALDGSSWLGLSDQVWFYSLLGVSVVHQVAGWFVFRTQLAFSLFTRLFRKHDMAVWAIIFFPLFLLRIVCSVGLGIADSGSLSWDRNLQVVLGVLLLIPVFYTAWSIKQFFGVWRALGGDHFRLEYQNMPLVKEGAFKYSSNAMYLFAFLFFWSTALLTGSLAALATALFQHAYIWVHMYCTEGPDMRLIYGNRA